MDNANERGFTLIELMITVAIIGVLASIAIPSFNRYVLKSKSVEAQINLKAIATAETAYSAEFGLYRECSNNPSAGIPGQTAADWDTGTHFEDIGFSPSNSKVYYQYRVAAGSSGTLDSSFEATATGNLDADANNAVYHVTEGVKVSQTGATLGYY